ncbi:MAG: DUF488 family protein [Candidatus Tectomicrobia bacterium]|nr:DUF488 family protein [Candidatus Tectomicrobia bacterium]
MKLKRIYQARSAEDGLRVLVERLWPRGLTKERAAVDRWLKEVAPSPALRTWYGHDAGRWQEFARRYREELRQRREAVACLRQQSRRGVLTLLFASRDAAHCSAAVLKEFLETEAD